MATPNSDFVQILETLVRHQVDFIIIGGVCAVLHGAPVTTLDLDVVHSRSPENLPRLLGALQELDAIYREMPERRLRPGLTHLNSPGHQLLLTNAGPLDLLGTISSGREFADLLPHTIQITLRDEIRIRMLNLETLIALKEEVGRDKDLAVLPILRQTLEEKGRG